MNTPALLVVVVPWLPVAFPAERSRQEIPDLDGYAREHLSDLRFSAYVTAPEVAGLLGSPGDRRKAPSVLRSLGVTKVYLESHRSGTLVEQELLASMRDFFRAGGFEVAGGIATTPGVSFGVRQEGRLNWLNFQSAKTQADLERVVRHTASVFDEVIIDDFLCTADVSEESRRARGQRTWPAYRRDLLSDISRRLIVQAAKDANPAATVTIKYPQWYDRFHLFGYDVVREPEIYDRVWVGTETRGPNTRRMGFVQEYQGFVNFRWLSSLAPEKVGGAWFDHIDCSARDFFDQALETVLAGAREIILFSYRDLAAGHPGHVLLRRHFARLTELARMVRENPARGVPAYKPPHSDAGGDMYLFDLLGMLGIPLVPAARYPQGAEVMLLATQAAEDPGLAGKIKQSVAAGRTVVATAGLLRRLHGLVDLKELAGVELAGGREGTLRSTRLLGAAGPVPFAAGLELEGEIRPAGARVLLAAILDGGERIPFLSRKEHASGGKLYVLNSHTFSEEDFEAAGEVLLPPRPVSLLDLPAEWVEQTRACFLDALGIRFQAPSRVSLHAFGSDNWVLCNFNDEPVKVTVEGAAFAAPGTERRVADRATGDVALLEAGRVTLELEERLFRWLVAAE